MSTIVTQLRSQVCPTDTQPAILYGDPYTIRFYTFTGAGAFQPELHEIAWDTNTRRITEKDWTGANAPPASANVTKVLLTNATPPPGTNAPIFSYWGFQQAADGTVNTDLSLPTPLSVTNTAKVVRVSVAFKTLPLTSSSPTAPSTTLQTDVFARTANPNGPDGPIDPVCS
jgi:hypothetical protein